MCGLVEELGSVVGTLIVLWISGFVRVGNGGVNFSVCVENLLCISISFRFLCLVNERNGWRGKSCERVGSFCIRCQCCRRMCEIGGRSVL